MDNSKSPFKSKTVWLNFIGLVLSAIALFWPGVGSVGSWVSANASIIGLGWSALNLILRAVTKDKLVLTD